MVGELPWLAVQVQGPLRRPDNRFCAAASHDFLSSLVTDLNVQDIVAKGLNALEYQTFTI